MASIPSLEKVRFTASGVEAVSGAVRVARAFTGRSAVVKIEGLHHGDIDALLRATAAAAEPGGVPEAVLRDSWALPYNDVDSVRLLFKRRPGEGPTLYPVACAPQSWAAGAVLMLLQAALGLTIDAPGRQVIFSRPVLPESLKTVCIHGLRVGEAAVDVVVERHAHDVGITVARRQGDVEIVTIK